MPEELMDYISRYLLKSGEQLVSNEAGFEAVRNADSDLVELKIMKKTARTLRMTGKFTVHKDAHILERAEDQPAPQLLTWSIHKRAMLSEEKQAFEWLHKGWIIREVRFKSDERTVDRIYYRMGYRLFMYLNKQAELQVAGAADELASYQRQARSLVREFKNVSGISGITKPPLSRLTPLVHHLQSIVDWELGDLNDSTLFPSLWRFDTRMRFLHFVLAVMAISSQKDKFDWKEIGARFKKEIGGSKVFDAFKDAFIELLEEWGMQPLESYGLVSLGKITPLYFAGQLNGEWSSYKAGPVHSLTDLSIAKDGYETEATTLWLVENRGVLTRLAAEKDFIKCTNSLVACVDGQLRSSHRKFIQQLLTSSPIRQVILWTDYDRPGLYISAQLQSAISITPSTLQEGDVLIKWICHDHQVVTSWAVYQSYMNTMLENGTQVEQEEVLGEKEDWIRWINL